MVLERLINLRYGTQAIFKGFIKTLNVLERKQSQFFVSYNLSGITWLLLKPMPQLDIFFVCLYQVLLYLQRCLEHAAGVTEEDRVKNCILPSVARYVKKLLMGPDSEGACDHFNLLLENVTFGINRVEEKQTRLNKEATCSLWEKFKSIFAKRVVPSRY